MFAPDGGTSTAWHFLSFQAVILQKGVHAGLSPWSKWPESNRHSQLGRLVFYR